MSSLLPASALAGGFGAVSVRYWKRNSTNLLKMSPSILSVAICLSNVSSAWSGSRSATGPVGAAPPASRTFGAQTIRRKAVGSLAPSACRARASELQFHQRIEPAGAKPGFSPTRWTETSAFARRRLK